VKRYLVDIDGFSPGSHGVHYKTFQRPIPISHLCDLCGLCAMIPVNLVSRPQATASAERLLRKVLDLFFAPGSLLGSGQ
jgi:hypothetical protein